MQEKLLIFPLHIKKLLTQIVCSHPVATGRFWNLVLFTMVVDNKQKIIT